MSDSRPVDLPLNAALRTRLETWLNQQNQTLLEEVMATWQQALIHFQPDEALLASLQEAAAPSPAEPLSGSGESQLSAALDLIEGATSQSDLLRRLMDALAPMVERSALFILKQGLASVYTHRGFEAAAIPKSGALVPPPELEALIQGLTRSVRHKGPAYAALLAPLSPFEAAEVAIFPLHHKRKAVALLVVDSGLCATLDHPEQVRALVLATSALLAALAAAHEQPPAPVPSPGSASAPPSRPEPPSSAPTQVIPETIETLPPVDLDPRTRAAAERLARVLVGDVELYFPAKVAQAQSQGNLYGLLRDELERSRANFVERFGEDVELQYRIFTNTLIQQLCNGDASRLGAAPWA
jgi:hypothetical protein